MRPYKLIVNLLILINASFVVASPSDNGVELLKAQILTLAKSYEGQGDPDQSKQKTLEPLVARLIELKPMPPVADRISTVSGVWKQVWGAYDYRNEKGGVDPKLGVKEIYQVVFADGYYYNVAPFYPDKNKNREQVGLLRGEFSLDPEDSNVLLVKFTDYPGVEPRPMGVHIWDLAAIAEAGQLQNEITIVPRWLVKLLFQRGKLEEVYTDHDLRILYGSNIKPNARRFLYIMSRIK